jgi:hypothetical protein
VPERCYEIWSVRVAVPAGRGLLSVRSASKGSLADYEGTYVGTLRARGMRQLWSEYLERYLYRGGPGVSLSWYRYVHVAPLPDDRDGLRHYVVGLFGDEKGYTVVESPEVLSDEDQEFLLRVRMRPGFMWTGDYPFARLYSALHVIDAADQTLLKFIDGDWYLTERSGLRKGLRNAVQQLLRARSVEPSTPDLFRGADGASHLH